MTDAPAMVAVTSDVYIFRFGYIAEFSFNVRSTSFHNFALCAVVANRTRLATSLLTIVILFEVLVVMVRCGASSVLISHEKKQMRHIDNNS